MLLPTLLEHVNLNIPDEAAARAFYVNLGGVVNPKTSNNRQLHINAGASQFHLLHRQSVRGMEPVECAQIWAGHIELWTGERLEELAARLPSSELSGSGASALLRCECPWGNRFVVRSAPVGFAPAGAHAGGCGQLLAMPKVVHLLRPGLAPSVAAFFRSVLHVGVQCDEPGRCAVPFASGQHLVFEESTEAPPRDAYDACKATSEYHLAFYLPSAAAFKAAFDSAAAAGLLYVNSRFEGGPLEFASPLSWQEAEEGGQFRVKDLRGPSAGDELGLVLELEVRAPTHVSCPLGSGAGAAG